MVPRLGGFVWLEAHGEIALSAHGDVLRGCKRDGEVVVPIHLWRTQTSAMGVARKKGRAQEMAIQLSISVDEAKEPAVEQNAFQEHGCPFWLLWAKNRGRSLVYLVFLFLCLSTRETHLFSTKRTALRSPARSLTFGGSNGGNPCVYPKRTPMPRSRRSRSSPTPIASPRSRGRPLDS